MSFIFKRRSLGSKNPMIVFFFFGKKKMFLLETLLIQKISFIIFFEKKFECDKIKIKNYLRKGKRFFFFF